MKANRRVFVTGASGFVGRNLAPLLAEWNGETIAVVRRNAPTQYDSTLVVDLADEVPDLPVAGPVDTLVHLAAKAHSRKATESDYQAHTVEVARNVAKACAKANIRRIIHVSSIGARIAEEDAKSARLYGKAKLAAESAFDEVLQGSGAQILTLRPPLVYGPDAPGNFGLLHRLIKAGAPLPFASARANRDYLSVENLAHLLCHLVTLEGDQFASLECKIYEPCDGSPISTRELSSHIAAIANRPARLFPLPVGLARLVGTALGKKDMVDGAFSGLSARPQPSLSEDANWQPPFSLEDGLKRALGSES